MTDAMTSRERVMKALAFEPTDRPPCDLMEGQVWPELQEDFRDRHGIESVEEIQDHLGADVRWLMFRDLEAPPAEQQDDTADESAVTADEQTYSFAVAHGPLAGAETVAEVEAHDWGNPDRYGPPDYAAARQRWPDHAIAFLTGWKPLFWGTCDLFGVEEALIKMRLEPAVYEAAVRCRHEFVMGLLRRCLPSGEGLCDICWLGDDFSSQQAMMLSPDDWRRFIKPYLAEEVRYARERGMQVIYHSCGAVHPVIGDLADIGVNCMLVFQTTAQGMEPERIAREFGGRIAFYGGMDVQHLLSFGTPEEVRAAVERNVRAFQDCGGYIVANAHHRVDTIKGSLLEVMCQAARGMRFDA